MSFSTPTTRDEMVTILKEIFHYYRIKREPYDGVELDPIILERMVYSPLSDFEIEEKARELLARKHLEEQSEKIEKVNKEYRQAINELNNLSANKEVKKQSIIDLHEKSMEKLQTEAVKNGVYNSTEYFNSIAKLETEKNLTLAQIEEEYALKSQELNAIISEYDAKIENANQLCSELFEKEIDAKITELKEKQQEKIREVFKYNNSLDEKEQRYQNTIKQTNASLLLKFMSLRQGEFTQDELVEMGYYKDVIACVCAYYDTLETLTAAREIVKDQDVPIYLDDYYDTIVYMYTQRAFA